MAATSVGCQSIWLRKLLVDLQQEQIGPTEIWCDNKETISMTKNPAFRSKTKHIDIHYHFIHDLVTGGIISLKFCGKNDQVVDVLTKSIPRNKHDFFRQNLFFMVLNFLVLEVLFFSFSGVMFYLVNAF